MAVKLYRDQRATQREGTADRSKERRRIDALSIDKRDIQIIKFHQRNQHHIVVRRSIVRRVDINVDKHARSFNPYY